MDCGGNLPRRSAAKAGAPRRHRFRPHRTHPNHPEPPARTIRPITSRIPPAGPTQSDRGSVTRSNAAHPPAFHLPTHPTTRSVLECGGPPPLAWHVRLLSSTQTHLPTEGEPLSPAPYVPDLPRPLTIARIADFACTPSALSWRDYSFVKTPNAGGRRIRRQARGPG